MGSILVHLIATAVCATSFSSAIATAPVDRAAWMDQARFGMFIHWGIYSLLGRGEWVMHREKIPVA